MPKLPAQARARKIKLLLFDVDGVLTDGKLFIFPAPAGTPQSVLEQSAKHGGEGALRDAVEFILKAQGKWKKIVEAYISERGPTVQ